MGIHFLFDILATSITFPLLLFLVRWIGKTQISQATYFNWVAGACMGNIGANILAADNAATIMNSAVELVLFSAMTVLASFIALKSRTFRSVTSGLPIILINDGDILFDNLKTCKVNKDLLKQMLREQGYFNYKHIKWAILEPTGILSVLPEGEKDGTVENQSAINQPLVKQKKKKH